MKIHRINTFCFFFIGLLSCSPLKSTVAEEPNVIFIFADDLGKEWISSYGAGEIKTDRIDELARNGLMFENFYAMPQCTPSRVSLFTGQYPFRDGWVNHWDVPRWGGGAHFDPDTNSSFARILQSAGYKNAAAGKWQVNDFRVQPEVMKEHGFDDYCIDAVIPIYDKEEFLFYRDDRFIEERSANGKKIFWSRGNGWVVGALPRILDNLEPNDPFREKYERLLREMSSSLIELQGDDGMWRASLLDPVEFPMKESSGTAFFCYGMAWGINNGILEKDKYLPAVLDAWEGLCNVVNEYGRVCYVQPGGASPVHFPERYTHAYAVGGFLLAGEQMIELIENI